MARRHARLFQRGRRRLTNRARSGGFGPGVEQREGVVLGDHLQQFDDIAVAVTAVGGEHRSRPARRTVKLHAERSEEHTSELQSLMRISYAVFCLKKKNQK